MSKRAERRKDSFRMKRKARRVYPNSTHPEKVADHLAACSCFMCGNPRRYGQGPSMAERRKLSGLDSSLFDLVDEFDPNIIIGTRWSV
jgi:hypothetical protein